MKSLTLGDLIEGMTGWHPEGTRMPVYPVIDSRKAAEGAVFFAFQGEHVDGHDYVEDALARGAIAAVVDRELHISVPILDLAKEPRPLEIVLPVVIRVPDVLQTLQKAATWWRQVLNPRVIGVTGSVGKTTTKEVVAKVLESRYQVRKSIGSQNNEIGLPLTVLSLDSTCERLVLELGMYVRGDIHRLDQIARPDVGIITNVEPVHAERAGSLDEIALGKRELIEDLPAAPKGTAILNYDDQRVRSMGPFTNAQLFTYGLAPEADLWADEVQGLGLNGIQLCLHYHDEAIKVTAPLLGYHNVYTVLRAAAAGLVEGLNWQEIIKGLNSPGPQLRLVTVRGPDDTLILDDTYNSSPPSALAALDLLYDLPGRKVAVLGDMLELGAYEEEGHLKVGCRAADVVSELITVGSLGEIIARGAEMCGLSRNHIHTAVDSSTAVDVLLAVLHPQDVVLVKGSRGMKMETIVAAVSEEPK
ncbi:MAG: UDP-N-acetylmuramoyl-tripeptide--D-alanyl-D-alanine ligase [Anaerolineales bacterium]|nr:MAG: UDP-N-acetylmuramoyl-tripeptide--D-alanyl-D-alanine ligase [Anaerolineales bacterium]